MYTFHFKSLLSVAVLAGVALFLGTTLASAQTLPEGVTQEQIDAALADISELYGAPVVRTDQAKAICNQEQYVIACAEIGKKHGLFPKDRVKQVDVLVEHMKGQVAKKIAACTDVDCLVKVANTIAKELAKEDAAVAQAVDLTPQKVEEKKNIVIAAKEAGVDFEACRTMDPDTAPVELLRACAKLAKDERVQKHIAEDVRNNADKADASIALKESLEKGEIQCGDNTIEGCGNFCLNPSEAAREQGVAAIPPICREIATRFFGPEGVQALEEAYTNVQGIKDAVERGENPAPIVDMRKNDNGTHPVVGCMPVYYPPCPQGEYRQESKGALGCPVMSACIPIPTKTLPKQIDGKVICPSMPTVNECPAGQEKFVTYSSPECGSYYACRPSREADKSIKFPYTFGNNKTVNSWDEAKSYCYQNGDEVRGECTARFGFIFTIPPVSRCEQYGVGWHSMDQGGNCFNPGNTEYRTPDGSAQRCDAAPVYGCANTTREQKCLSDQYWNGTTCMKRDVPAGQKSQVWNSHGLQSWVREDADQARIADLKNACANVLNSSANIWMSGAGDSNSKDFGMPDPDKCKKASECTSSQYFDGTNCKSGSDNTWKGQGKTQIWNSYGLQSWIREDADPARIASLKQTCAEVKSSGANIWMRGGGDYNSKDFGMPDPDKCKAAAQCTSDQYFNGSSCVGGGYMASTTATGGCWLNATESSCRASTLGCRWDTTVGGSPCMPAGTGAVASTTVTGTCSGDMIDLLGSSCFNNGSAWFNGERTKYVLPGTKQIVSCTLNPISGCTNATTSTCPVGQTWNGTMCAYDTSTPDGCAKAGRMWDTANAYCKAPPPLPTGVSVTSAQYQCAAAGGTWNETNKFCSMPMTQSTDAMIQGCKSAGGTWDSSANYCKMPSTYYTNNPSNPYSSSYASSTTSSSSSMKRCFYTNASRNGAPLGYSVWCEADYSGCRKYSSTGEALTLEGVSLGAPSSCEGGWNSGSTAGSNSPSCGSLMNQSACVANSACQWSTSSNTCMYNSSSGNYSGYGHTCASNEYWDSRFNGCRSMQTACTEAGGTWDSATNYCRMPNTNYGTSYSTSSSTGSYNSMSAQQGCTSAGGTWDSSANYCRMPNARTGTSCGAGMYWNGSACVSSGTGGTMDTASMQAGCTSAGGTWMGTYCKMPGTSYFCPSGYAWTGSHCTYARGATTQTASVFQSILGILGF